ncbi:MAG: histidine phosphatase family protein [Planctomycetaceae bacterium]|nr:histidine phosphatase family protein [Planctomycetaceae bacterium]
MPRLLLMRHAKSDWDHAGLADIDRPLNKRGRRNATEMGGWLVEQGAVPDLILVSPACRAQETIVLLTAEFGHSKPEVRTCEGLYPCSPQAIAQSIATVSDTLETILIAAHNPAMEIVVDMIGGRAEHFPTGAVADVEVVGRTWLAAVADSVGFFSHCELRQIWRPRTLFEDNDAKKR